MGGQGRIGKGAAPGALRRAGTRRGLERRDLFVLGRSVGICALLGGGIVALATLGAEVSAARPVTVVSAASLVIPTSTARIVPEAPVRPVALAAPAPAETGAPIDGRVDRVSYEFLESLAMTPGDPNQVLEFGPMKIRRHLVQTIVRAAREVGTDPELLMAIADKESSFATEVQAKTSSATGLFQFIEKTWLGVVHKFGAQYGLSKESAVVVYGEDGWTVPNPEEKARILELRREPRLSALLAGEMLKRDSARISERIGRPLTHGETYLAHFLGPGDAERFMAKVVEQPSSAAAQLLPKPAKSNKTIFFAKAGRRKVKSLSVAEVHAKFETMMGTRSARYKNVGPISGITAYADASQ
jgi:hypothetical protein